MIAATVYNQLVSTLTDNPTLAEYVNNVFKGNRFNIEPDSMPCIMAEIRGNNEIETDFGQIKKVWLDVDVMAIVASPADPEYAIVGKKELDYIGVMDIENDIRACLQSSNTLGGVAIDTRAQATIFQEFELKGVITRGVIVPVRILYRQTDGV